VHRFLGLSGLALFVFFAKYQRTVDPEWYWPLTQEGYLNSYAIFLVRQRLQGPSFQLVHKLLTWLTTGCLQVTWIIAYNAAHVK
jgi:hypothetical protein